MDDAKLRMLLTTLERGSFNRAAEQLLCTQSAVTQAMNSLENELGLKILFRNHNGVQLTEEGTRLLPYIEAASAALDNLRDKAEELRQGKASLLRIGTFSSISTTWLPKAIQLFRQEHPSSRFSIRIGTNIVPKWLKRHEIDVALVDRLRSADFDFHPLVEDPYFAVAAPGFFDASVTVISQEELLSHPFITAPQNALQQLLPRIPQDCISIDTDDDSSIITLIEKGFGVTAMPQLSLCALRPKLQIMALKPPVTRTLGIALPSAPTRMAEQFCTFLCAHKEKYISAASIL